MSDNIIEEIISKVKIAKDSYKPKILDLKLESDRGELARLKEQGLINYVVDDFEEQQRELYAVNNPTKVYTPDFENLFKGYYTELGKSIPIWQSGKWVYYPWSSTLVHILDDLDFQKVRFARNRNLISEDEQLKFYNAVIGIGGLSVGNSVALSIVLQGGAKHIKLADLDRLALSNLNRIRSGVENLGELKVVMTARQIYSINPYAKVELFTDGLTESNIDDFFVGSAKLDLVIDELDNMAIKMLIRHKAAEYKVPVAMGADNGDNAIIDIERYDLTPQPKYFHGRLGDMTYKDLLGLDKFGIGKTITQFLGAENITERMQGSFLEMGKTIVSWPQLGGAALLNGSAVAYCVRKILNGEDVEHNRAIISFDEIMTPSYNSEEMLKSRKENSDKFKKIFGL